MAIDLSQVRVSGPLSAFAIGFADNLVQQGYRPRVTCNHMRLLAHLSQWLGSDGLGGSGLHVGAVERFLRARRAAGYTALLWDNAVRPILAVLRRRGVAPMP